MDRETVPRYQNQGDTDKEDLQNMDSMVRCSNCHTFSTESTTFCVLRALKQLTFNGERRPAQRPERSSQGAAAAVPPRRTEPSPAENIHRIVCCKLACDARTCNDGRAASPPNSLMVSWKAQKTLSPKSSLPGPGSAFRVEQPLSPRRATYPGSGEGVVVASWL